jgi:apolipoprotein N-acyltransferase
MMTRAIAYTPFWRVFAGALVLISRAGALAIVIAMFFFETRLDNPLRLLRTFGFACFAPGLAAWLLARAFAAGITIGNGTVIVTRRDRRVEIPGDAIARVDPWTVPLPGAGLWLGLRSGRRLPLGLQVGDPVALIDALAEAGADDEVRTAAHRPAALYGRGRRDFPWYRALLEFPILALVPTLPIFRLHQWIAFGGTFGEYYTYGLRAYLLGFAAQWWTFTIHLVLYAAVLRAAAEAIVMTTAWAAPARVATVRRIVERIDRVLYFGAIPVFLIRLALLT